MKGSLLDLAVKNFENENFPKAIQLFEKILKLDPDNPVALINNSSCLAEIGKYEEAMEQLELFLKKYPNDFDALYNKATTLYDMDRYEEALDTFEIALKIDSKKQFSYQ